MLSKKALFIITPIIISMLGVSIFLAVYFEPRKNGIEIKSDADFRRYALPGNGDSDNPFRIENIEFKSGASIKVRDTTKHFIIKNCRFVNTYKKSGVSLIDVAPGTAQIFGCTFLNCSDGISSLNCSSFIVDSNVMIDCKDSLFVSIGNDLIIRNNIFSGTLHIESEYVYQLINNTIYSDCYLVGSKGRTIIENNTFYDGRLFFCSKYGCDNISLNINETTICGNTIEDKPFGFYYNQSDISITQEHSMVWLFYCNNVSISQQNTYNVTYGIVCAYSTNVSIYDCTFNKNGRAIALVQCDNIDIYDISVIGGFIISSGVMIEVAYAAIYAEQCNEVNCTNIFSTSTINYGFFFNYCNYSFISESYITNAWRGVYIKGGEWNFVRNSEFTDCSTGMFVLGSSRNIANNHYIINNIIEHPYTGITIAHANSTLLAHNIIYDPYYAAFLIEYCDSITILYNYITIFGMFTTTEAFIVTDSTNIVETNNTVSYVI